MLLYAKSLLTAAILVHIQLGGFVNIQIDVIVSDCVRGQTTYHTHFYKYTRQGLEFVDDSTGKIVKASMSEDNGSSFYLTEPEKKF